MRLITTTTRAAVPTSLGALLPLLLIPTVISGFFLVYALVGAVLEGIDLQRWAYEARSVALPTTLVQTGCCGFIIACARRRHLPWNHLFNWVCLVHALLALVLLGSVYSWSA